MLPWSVMPDGRLAVGGRGGDDVADPRGAVEHRVLGVQMQVGERIAHERSLVAGGIRTLARRDRRSEPACTPCGTGSARPIAGRLGCYLTVATVSLHTATIHTHHTPSAPSPSPQSVDVHQHSTPDFQGGTREHNYSSGLQGASSRTRVKSFACAQMGWPVPDSCSNSPYISYDD